MIGKGTAEGQCEYCDRLPNWLIVIITSCGIRTSNDVAAIKPIDRFDQQIRCRFHAALVIISSIFYWEDGTVEFEHVQLWHHWPSDNR
jgi:hypothetical protein